MFVESREADLHHKKSKFQERIKSWRRHTAENDLAYDKLILDMLIIDYKGYEANQIDESNLSDIFNTWSEDKTE